MDLLDGARLREVDKTGVVWEEILGWLAVGAEAVEF